MVFSGTPPTAVTVETPVRSCSAGESTRSNSTASALVKCALPVPGPETYAVMVPKKRSPMKNTKVAVRSTGREAISRRHRSNLSKRSPSWPLGQRSHQWWSGRVPAWPGRTACLSRRGRAGEQPSLGPGAGFQSRSHYRSPNRRRRQRSSCLALRSAAQILDRIGISPVAVIRPGCHLSRWLPANITEPS